MAQGPETLLVNKMREAILREWPSAFLYKTHGDPFQTSGLPDLMGCINGRMFGFEVKARKKGERVETLLGRVTPKQSLTLRKMKRAGAITGVVWEVDQVMANLRGVAR